MAQQHPTVLPNRLCGNTGLNLTAIACMSPLDLSDQLSSFIQSKSRCTDNAVLKQCTESSLSSRDNERLKL